MADLRIGIVGSDFIARRKHLPAWGKVSRRAQVVSPCDVNAARAEGQAREHGVPTVYADFGQMLEKERLDAVDICSPPRTHATLALQSLRSGVHVLIEKPAAVSIGECDAVIAPAQETCHKVCVAHSDLSYPSFLKAREQVERGETGEFRETRLTLSTPVDYVTSRRDYWPTGCPAEASANPVPTEFK